jgi:hypothetical protein
MPPHDTFCNLTWPSEYLGKGRLAHPDPCANAELLGFVRVQLGVGQNVVDGGQVAAGAVNLDSLIGCAGNLALFYALSAYPFGKLSDVTTELKCSSSDLT